MPARFLTTPEVSLTLVEAVCQWCHEELHQQKTMTVLMNRLQNGLFVAALCWSR